MIEGNGFIWICLENRNPPQKKGWLKKYVFQSKDELFKEVYIYIYNYIGVNCNISIT